MRSIGERVGAGNWKRFTRAIVGPKGTPGAAPLDRFSGLSGAIGALMLASWEAEKMGDTMTIGDVLRSFSGFVRKTLAHLGVHARDLDDVAQAVARGVARGLATFDASGAESPETALRGWLFGICQRQAASYRRSAFRRAENLSEPDDLDALATSDESVEQAMIGAQHRAAVWRAIGALEARRRAVLVAHDLEGQEMIDVAAALGIKPATAWNLRRLARRDFRANYLRALAARRRG